MLDRDVDVIILENTLIRIVLSEDWKNKEII